MSTNTKQGVAGWKNQASSWDVQESKYIYEEMRELLQSGYAKYLSSETLSRLEGLLVRSGGLNALHN